jgi:hypothetical protein
MEKSMTGKTVAAINRLPEKPEKKIYWVVYNKDMIKYTENLIAEIRGKSYLKKHVKVVSLEKKEGANNTIYLDPMLMDHIGNGQG